MERSLKSHDSMGIIGKSYLNFTGMNRWKHSWESILSKFYWFKCINPTYIKKVRYQWCSRYRELNFSITSLFHLHADSKSMLLIYFFKLTLAMTFSLIDTKFRSSAMKPSHQTLWPSYSVCFHGVKARGIQVYTGNHIHNLSGEFLSKAYCLILNNQYCWVSVTFSLLFLQEQPWYRQAHEHSDSLNVEESILHDIRGTIRLNIKENWFCARVNRSFFSHSHS